MSNALRMPFAEWLGKMAECGVPPAGRVVAIYAAVFEITKNNELARVTGVSPRSLDKHKQHLVANGWIIIPPCRGGRGNGLEVVPAYRDQPVTFTDVKPRKGGKYYPRNSCETPAEFAEVLEAETPAEFAQTPAKTAPFVETPAEFAEVSTRAVVSNNIIYNNNLTKPNNITTAARENSLTVQDMDSLSEQLLQACNGALDNPVNCLGLASLATPIMWLREGCDLETDIIPTLRGYGKSAHGKRIKTWDYFTRGIQKARDMRVNGLGAEKAARQPETKESEVEKIHRLVRQASDRQRRAP